MFEIYYISDKSVVIKRGACITVVVNSLDTTTMSKILIYFKAEAYWCTADEAIQ